MNTDQLKSFIQVAENLNFARAAEILKITQSAVSRQIHSLEDELGAKLLHRTTRTVTLTPAGISFLEDAKNVMGRLKIAEQKLQRHQSTNLQVLTIGCQSEANLDLLCKILKSCREQLPELYPFLKTSLDKGIQEKEAKKVLPTLHKTPPNGTIGGVFVCRRKALNPRPHGYATPIVTRRYLHGRQNQDQLHAGSVRRPSPFRTGAGGDSWHGRRPAPSAEVIDLSNVRAEADKAPGKGKRAAPSKGAPPTPLRRPPGPAA